MQLSSGMSSRHGQGMVKPRGRVGTMPEAAQHGRRLREALGRNGRGDATARSPWLRPLTVGIRAPCWDGAETEEAARRGA